MLRVWGRGSCSAPAFSAGLPAAASGQALPPCLHWSVASVRGLRTPGLSCSLWSLLLGGVLSLTRIVPWRYNNNGRRAADKAASGLGRRIWENGPALQRIGFTRPYSGRVVSRVDEVATCHCWMRRRTRSSTLLFFSPPSHNPLLLPPLFLPSLSRCMGLLELGSSTVLSPLKSLRPN